MFYFKSKSKRNLVAKVATKPKFLVAKEKILVALVTILVPILSSAKAAFIVYMLWFNFILGSNFLFFCFWVW